VRAEKKERRMIKEIACLGTMMAAMSILGMSNPDGLLTASSAADLDAAAEDGNLVFGRGMLKWTGGGRLFLR
jgi:hypothetical protein